MPLPALLSEPLLKSSNGQIVGYQSGVRSALIKVGSNWYRLKGCGNNYDGFPLKEVEGQKDALQIRGTFVTNLLFDR